MHPVHGLYGHCSQQELMCDFLFCRKHQVRLHYLPLCFKLRGPTHGPGNRKVWIRRASVSWCRLLRVRRCALLAARWVLAWMTLNGARNLFLGKFCMVLTMKNKVIHVERIRRSFCLHRYSPAWDGIPVPNGSAGALVAAQNRNGGGNLGGFGATSAGSSTARPF